MYNIALQPLLQIENVTILMNVKPEYEAANVAAHSTLSYTI